MHFNPAVIWQDLKYLNFAIASWVGRITLAGGEEAPTASRPPALVSYETCEFKKDDSRSFQSSRIQTGSAAISRTGGVESAAYSAGRRCSLRSSGKRTRPTLCAGTFVDGGPDGIQRGCRAA